MTYHAMWLLGNDQDFANRVQMCAVEQGWPPSWVAENRWLVAAAPGFGAAYQYALDTGVPDPGKAQEVISDQQILAVVQAAGVPPN